MSIEIRKSSRNLHSESAIRIVGIPYDVFSVRKSTAYLSAPSSLSQATVPCPLEILARQHRQDAPVFPSRCGVRACVRGGPSQKGAHPAFDSGIASLSLGKRSKIPVKINCPRVAMLSKGNPIA